MAEWIRHFFMNIENTTAYILFDGDCNLCNRTVKFISKRNKNNRFTILSLQSEKGKDLQAQWKINSNIDSVILVKENSVYYESDAIISILKDLNGPYRFIGHAAALLPKKLRDILYRIIARNRYRWFGKSNSC
jgi:predicted DCC family thiol-disulfide oxidoreductase YuxK